MFEYSVVCVLSSSFLLFCAMTANTWPSPSISKLNAPGGPFDGTLTVDEESWLGSLTTLGCIAGPLLGGFLSQKLGRKWSMILYAIPIALSYFVMAFAKKMYLFYAARLTIGFVMGSILAVIPVYIGEMSLNEHRGFLTAVIGIFINIGTLVPLVIGPFISVEAFNLMLGCLPLVFIVEFAFIGVESPHFYVEKGDNNQAELVLRKIRNCSDEEIKKEMKLLTHLIEGEEHGTIYDIIKSRGMIRAMIMSLTLFTLINLSGLMVISTYAQQIFEKAGSSIPAEYSAMIVGVVSLIASTFIPFVVMFVGRRPMLITSTLTTALGEISLGIFLYLGSHGSDMSSYNFVPLVLLLEIIIASTFGFIMIPFMLLSEIFPNATKGIASGITASYSSLIGFAVTKFFPILSNSLGPGPVFMGFGVFSIVACVYTYFFVIETKGKTLKDILDELNS